MLKTLRTRTRKVMLVTLILVIPSFVFYFGWQSIRGRQTAREQMERARFRPPQSFRWATGRGGWVYLTETDLLMARREMLQDFANAYGQDFMNGPGRDIDEEALFPIQDIIAHYVDQWFLQRLADQRHIEVSDAELTDAIENIFGNHPVELREQALRQQGLTVSQFENQLRSEGRIQRVKQLFYAQARPSHAQLWDAYIMEKEEMRVDYAPFFATEYRNKVEKTDAQLEAYFKENGEKFRVGDQRRYRYALLKKETLQSQIQVSPEEVQKYYEDHKQKEYTHARQVKARQVLVRMNNPSDASVQQRQELTSQTLIKAQLVRSEAAAAEDFARFANEYNAAAGTTSATLSGAFLKPGGLIEGWISPERNPELGPSFVKAALELQKGQVSAPVHVAVPVSGSFARAEGLAVIKCEDVREAGISPFEEIAAQVKKDCLAKKRDALFQDKEKELRREVFNYTTIDALAKAKGMEEGLTSWVLTTSPMISRDLFLDKTELDYLNSDLRKGEVSSLLRTEDGNTLFVLYLEDEQPSHIPSDFREIRVQVESAYVAEKSLDLGKKAAEDYLARLTPADFATTSSVKLENRVKTTPFFARRDSSKQFPTPLIDFTKDTFLATTHTMGLSTMGMDKNGILGYAAWHVRNLKTPTSEDFKKDLPAMERSAAFSEGEGLVNEWLWDQRSMTTIEDLSKNKAKEEGTAAEAETEN